MTTEMITKMKTYIKKNNDVWLPEIPIDVRSEHLSIIWSSLAGVETTSEVAIDLGKKCLKGGRAPFKGDLQAIQRYLQEVSILLLVYSNVPPSLPAVPAILTSLLIGSTDSSSPLHSLKGEGSLSERLMSGVVERKQIINCLSYLDKHGVKSLSDTNIPDTEIPMYRDIERE